MKIVEIDEEAFQAFIKANKRLHNLILEKINDRSVLKAGRKNATTLKSLLASIKEAEQ